MRLLLAVTIAMGVLIVAGVAVLVVAIGQRLGGSAPAEVVLREAAGTRISGASVGGDRVAVQLTGGGPDRVVVIETRTGRIVATIGLMP